MTAQTIPFPIDAEVVFIGKSLGRLNGEPVRLLIASGGPSAIVSMAGSRCRV